MRLYLGSGTSQVRRICAAIGVMLPSLIAFCLLLQVSGPELGRQAAVFRQNQLADAVLANNQQELLAAIDAHANLNSPILLSAERLAALARASARLDHYFREETKATPLILAAALGEKELCATLVERGAERSALPPGDGFQLNTRRGADSRNWREHSSIRSARDSF